MTKKITKTVKSLPLLLMAVCLGFFGVIMSIIGCSTLIYRFTGNNFFGLIHLLLHGKPMPAEDVGFYVVGELGIGILLIVVALFSWFKSKKMRV